MLLQTTQARSTKLLKEGIYFGLIFGCLVLFPFTTRSQQSVAEQFPDSLNKCRLVAVTATTATLYAGGITSLYFLWYRDYPQSSFHFYNDNHHWLKMDKFGHATTAYQLGYYGYRALRWTGLDEGRSVWIGGSLGFIFLTSIEMLDGYSAEWGFSLGDMAANTLGAALFISQQLSWKEQRIQMKFSFSQTEYARYRPSLLGSNLGEQIIKDYNGQTYWASANIQSFLSAESNFPAWINLAVGYGAKGMTGSYINPDAIDGVQLPHFERVSQFYLSPDINLTRIPTNNKALKFTLTLLNFIKVPMPALEYNSADGFKLHLIHF
jgi:hypothetical protein